MRRLGTLLALLLGFAVWPAAASPPTTAVSLVISELDPDQSGQDTLEFVELAGPPGMPLAGYRLVFFSAGSTPPRAYRVVRLDGQQLDARGRLVVGSPLVANVAVVAWEINGLQNGGGTPDAVALYRDDAAPLTPTPAGLVDVVVYGDRDDPSFRARFDPRNPPPLQPLDRPTTAIGRTSSGSFASDLPPSPGFPNAPVRLNELLGDGSVELLGMPGTSLGTSRLQVWDGAGSLLAERPLSGVLSRGGSFPGSLLLPPFAAAVPAAGETRVLILLAEGEVVDALALGGQPGPILQQLGLPLAPLPREGLAVGRVGGLGAAFGPVIPSGGGPNQLPPVATVAIGEARGPAGLPLRCPGPPAWSGRTVRLEGVVTARLRRGGENIAVLQDEGDGDPLSADAILLPGLVELAVGERVVVRGSPTLREGQAVLANAVLEQRLGSAALPSPLVIPAGPLTPCDWARWDSMRVLLPAGGSCREPAGAAREW
ncbi:MAG: hypothetical protein KatS3mg061_0348 [Dehalococcoidia bacterium]|nr:MAG: hypothetical protein KatS3mg061_0348 [Dehalococcoidia bacterium]